MDFYHSDVPVWRFGTHDPRADGSAYLRTRSAKSRFPETELVAALFGSAVSDRCYETRPVKSLLRSMGDRHVARDNVG